MIQRTQDNTGRAAVQPLLTPFPMTVIDHYDLDDGDATHPIHVPYLIPQSPVPMAGLIKVTLSWHLMAFRSTVNLNPSTIGSDATGESGHSHSHKHTLIWAGGSGGAGVSEISNTLAVNGGPITDTTAAQSDATGSSGHSHSHSHSLSGGANQAVTDGPTNTVTAVAMDGSDVSSQLTPAAPWPADQIEIDVTTLIPTAIGYFHDVVLSISGLGRVMTLLRFYYSTS